jgi:flavin-dependent dehydrogenase
MITKGEVFIGDKKIVNYERENQGFILNRPEFLVELGKQAEDLGTIIRTDHPIQSINQLSADVIIDASGSRNQFKKELGIKRRSYGLSYQETLRNSNHYIPDTIQIFWSKKNGYYWIFPRDPNYKEINIGLGFFGRTQENLKELLQVFKQENGIIGDVDYVTGGIIPFGLQRPVKYKNILFVGDTAVGTFPLSGQGIFRALISGDIAGECIVNDKINHYPRIIRKEFISREEVVAQTFLTVIEVVKRINQNLVFKMVPPLFQVSNSIDRYALH